jgi:hypothetical protein
MHIVHALNLNVTVKEDEPAPDLGKLMYGVVGIMFSVEDFDRSISIGNNESV